LPRRLGDISRSGGERILLGRIVFELRSFRTAGREAGAQDVVRRNVRYGHGMNVAVRALAVIGFIRYLRRFVPIGGENALAARALEGEPEAANAAEEVYEAGSLFVGTPALTPALSPRRGRSVRSHAVPRRVFVERGRARHSVRAVLRF